MKTGIVFVLLAGLLAAATAFASGGAEPAPAAAAEKGPLTVSAIVGFSGGHEYPKPGNAVEQAILKHAGVKLVMESYPDTEIEKIYAVRLASGDLSDLIVPGWTTINKSSFLQAIKAGTFWEIEKYIPEYKNLSTKVNPISYENVRIDGKLYAIPNCRTLVRRNFAYRKDWADRLGLKVPDTAQALAEMAKAMKKANPQGYGLVMDKGALSHLAFINGAPNEWAADETAFVRAETTREYMNGLKYARQLLVDGGLHPEFAIITRDQYRALFEEGKAGIMRDQLMYTNAAEARLKKNVPGSEMWIATYFKGPDGKVRTIGETGHNGGIFITKKVKDEATVKQILRFLDKMQDPEMANIWVWGFEGEHYTLSNGKPRRIADKQSAYDALVTHPYRYQFAGAWPENTAALGDESPVVLERFKTEKEAEDPKYLVPLVAFPFYSQTNAEKGSALQQILADAGIKFVMGQITEDQYWQAVEQWKKQGGEQMAREYATAWKASKKK